MPMSQKARQFHQILDLVDNTEDEILSFFYLNYFIIKRKKS